MLTAAGHRVVLGAVIVLAIGALIAAQGAGENDVRPASAAPAVIDSGPVTTLPPDTTPPTTPETTVAPDTTVVVGEVGQVGVFTPAAGRSRVTGTGPLVTYHVEVEDAVGVDVEDFAAVVDATLADPRSWTADGAVSFRRVARNAQVRVVLATPATVDSLCLPLQTNGLYSCHQNGTVALNSTRWINGTDQWPGPLDQFHAYAVNHEMGHAIGHGHVSCEGSGQLAPVMMQQSKGLNGCLPNGWPFPFP